MNQLKLSSMTVFTNYPALASPVSLTIGKGVWFSIRLSSFLLYSVQEQELNCRNCKRLREFEEIELSRQSCRGDCK